MTTDFTEEKQLASGWFRSLRDQIVAAFEELEETHSEGPFNDLSPRKFEVTTTRRTSDDGSDAGGGLMSVMRGGRVFEKVGVNVSTVFGTLGKEAQMAMAARKNIHRPRLLILDTNLRHVDPNAVFVDCENAVYLRQTQYKGSNPNHRQTTRHVVSRTFAYSCELLGIWGCAYEQQG